MDFTSPRRVSVVSEAPHHPAPTRPYQKPNRLNVACTQCRRRKVRCDASLPRCRHCRLRGEKCETLDLREATRGLTNDQAAVVGDISGDGCSVLAVVTDGQPHLRSRIRQRSRSNRASSQVADRTTQNRPLPATEMLDSHARRESPPVEDVSWVSRAYQASAVENHHGQNITNHHEDDGPTENANGNSVTNADAAAATTTTPDVVLNTDETSSRTKFLGGSSVQSLCSFVDLHLAAIGLEPIGACFNDGMRHSEEFPVPLFLLGGAATSGITSSSLPPLPPRGEMALYTSIFLKRLWPLIPVVDPASLEADINTFLAIQEAQGGAAEAGILAHLAAAPAQVAPALVMAYSVVCIGHDELHGGGGGVVMGATTTAQSSSTRYLGAAYALYAQLVGSPYVASVQALVLLALALRGQVKEGQAWQVLGQAVRIAHSIGLHKRAEGLLLARNRDGGESRTGGREQAKSARRRGGSDENMTAGPPDSVVLQSRIWWSCCALERVMQLESGRPSQLGDTGDCCLPGSLAVMASLVGGFFASWYGLTVIMGRIAQEVYVKKPATLLDLLQKVQELDGTLLRWEASRYRERGNDCSLENDDDDDGYLSSVLLLQYNFAHITLLRISIMFPPKVYHAELCKYQSQLTSHNRLRNGSHFCSTAARATITEALHHADHRNTTSTSSSPLCAGGSAVWLTTSPLFLSIIVLALGILQQPQRRMASADLEMLSLGTELFETTLSRWMGNVGSASSCDGGDSGARPGFSSIGRTLHARVALYYKLFQERNLGKTMTTTTTTSGIVTENTVAIPGVPALADTTHDGVSSLMLLADLSSSSSSVRNRRLEHQQQHLHHHHHQHGGSIRAEQARNNNNNTLVSDSAYTSAPQASGALSTLGEVTSMTTTTPAGQLQQAQVVHQASTAWHSATTTTPFQGLDFNDVWDMLGSDLLLDEHSISFA
ncbi:uncharacterized protein B0I36DRAFT_388092 [Microdochium trichocladiopsis]|uniref:Zn(2)-C6 fungal-type domain-containing protein n=1 Tax=Microdochium trichocladiopsis TaxID=1682393 RepID=A0A9P8XWB1_9PEZI|nr:uncharacterized protein B0I36DRAFT_388092 [Microdochium trichocladiopsis]KAH7021365.1 hypothetical protein B0I36DRAFT_388092 [Microdochium trichocladiopsis]